MKTPPFHALSLEDGDCYKCWGGLTDSLERGGFQSTDLGEVKGGIKAVGVEFGSSWVKGVL